MRGKLCAAIALVLFPIASAAQDHTKRFEVYGQIGAGLTYDDEGRIGNGLAGGGGIGFRFTPRVGAEFDVNAFRNDRSVALGQVRLKGNGQYYTGNLVFHFTRGGAQPYVVVGIGGLRYQNESSAGSVQLRQTFNGFAGDFGFGVKIFASEHWSIRPEVRAYAGANPPSAIVEGVISNLRVSIGLGYHW